MTQTMMGVGHPPVILASGSAIRATVLRAAGLVFDVVPPQVDEGEVKRALQADRASAEACATALAELKAQRVSAKHAGALVIGADQMLECDGAWFDKPDGRAGAVAHLRALRGKTHALVGAVVLAQAGRIIWRHVERARLTMRSFDDAFIDTYLDATGDAVLQSVGGYQLEGLGVQLFSHVDGDHFMILGLPLLPLLDILRQHKVVP